jgi:transcriptional regulator with XRE-family HTH domain
MPNKAVALRFAKLLREQRKKHGLTQEKLAELAELSVEHIQRLEGKLPSGIRLETLVKLSKALKTTPSSLLKNL